jgi:glucose-1-phosphate thymidylyltransferase
VIVGIVPAAGYATRLQPLHLSKEVYPIGGRPVMDYLVERMRAAPCDELRVVTRPDKRDVIENAKRHGATVIEAQPVSLAESFATGMRGLAGDDVVLFGFPDAIWHPADAYRRILPLLESGWKVALGLFPAADLTRYEPVVFDESSRVLRIEFKPPRPSSSFIWGCAAATASALSSLEEEEEPGVLFNKLAASGAVGCLPLEGSYLDMGTPQGLSEAEASCHT